MDDDQTVRCEERQRLLSSSEIELKRERGRDSFESVVASRQLKMRS